MFFLLIPVAMVVSSTVAGLTGGAAWVAAAAVNSEFHRRKGYKPNEGHFTFRCRGQHYGVEADESSSYDLNQALGILAKSLPSMIPKNLQFDLTQSEGEFLRAMIKPALLAFENFDAARQLAIEENESEESIQLLNEQIESLVTACLPISKYLEQFPRQRNKS